MAGRHAAGRSRDERRGEHGDERGDEGAHERWWERLEPAGGSVRWPLGRPEDDGSSVAAGAGAAGPRGDVDGGSTPPDPAESPPVVPGYVVERRLGRGGSGDVWRARREGTSPGEGAPVALKVLRASVAGDAAARRRLEHEASVLASLPDEHVVPLLGVVQAAPPGAATVLVLEHAPGGSLAAIVARRGALDAGEAVTVLVPLAGVLDRLHAGGVVHGDVAPGNVLFAGDGRPLLGDLGTAALLACGAPADGRAARGEGADGEGADGEGDADVTTGYADPGRAAGGPPTAAGDVFALGACAWHALTTLPPGVPGARPPLVTLRPDLPAALVDLVEDCLEPDDRSRPSAAELARRAWEAAEAEPVRLVGTDPLAPPDEVITHRVRAAARRSAPAEVPLRGRRRVGRPPTGALVLGAVGAVALLALAVLGGGALARGPSPADGSAEVVARGAVTTPAVGDPPATDPPVPSPPPRSASAPTSVAPSPGGLLGDDPVAAVQALADLRAEAFAARDARVLARAVVPGSPAMAVDERSMAALAARAGRLQGLQVDVVSAELVGGAGPEEGGTAFVDVRTRTSDHRLVSDGGEVLEEVAGSPDSRARLSLVRGEGVWRVADVLPVP